MQESQKPQNNFDFSALITGLRRAISPPPDRTPWEWANEKRILPSDTPEPGPFDSDRAPWAKAISAAHTSPYFDFIVAVMGSQMGKTETLFNICGHNFDDVPAPMLWVTPNRKLAESISKSRLRAMLRGIPSLWAGLAKGKSETITEKFINAARLGFAWAGSATELASHSVKSGLVDERDRMSNDIGGEGDPTEMIKARVSNWIGGTVTSVSTPTTGRVEVENIGGLEFWAVGEKDDVFSPIWQDFQLGSRHHWAWCCPHCNEYFIPRLELLQINAEWTPRQARKKAFMACRNCGGEIHEADKVELNRTAIFISPDQVIDEVDHPAGGVWVTQKDSAPFGYEMDEAGRYFLPYHEMVPVEGMTTASFWVSGLCTNWKTFGDRAYTFQSAKRKGEPGVEQSAVNTAFGELYNVSGDAPPWEMVKEKEGTYSVNTVPYGVQFLTAGVDVQKDGFFVVIRGWGFNRESWLIAADQIHGPTDQEATWQSLFEFLQNGRGGYPIRRILIDSAFKAASKNESHRVYEFAAIHFPWIVPARGRKTMDKHYRYTDITDKLANPGTQLQLCVINTDYFKSWVHSRVRSDPEQFGGWHVYNGITDNYCKQVTAESRLITDRGFFWIKIRKDNHYFDCETLATVAAEIEAVGSLVPLPNQKTDSQETKTLPPATPQNAPPQRTRRRGARGKGVTF